MREAHAMKLYSGDLSPYSAKVRMQIYAKGIEGITFERPPGFPTQEWRKTSPIGRIPVLELAPGNVIPESEVITEYLEELYPEPSLLGATPRERAAVRTLARLADLYLLDNMFKLAGQTRASTRSEAVRDLLAGQVLRGVEALEQMIGGEGGYALGGRVTLADCTLVPALFMIENVLPATDTPDPIPATPKVAAYWAAIANDASAAQVIEEMTRGLEERRQLIRDMAARAQAAS
jgi:glutathione S-transferase